MDFSNKIKIFSYLTLIVLLQHRAAYSVVVDYGSCFTALGERARCIDLEQCNYLYELIGKPSMTGDEVAYLRHSQCGYQSDHILICCPAYFIWSEGMHKAGEQLLPKTPYCGSMVKSKPSGEGVAGMDEFPWVVLIEYTTPDDIKKHKCEGVLINNRYVLTAGHCVAESNLPTGWYVSGVRLGEWDTTINPDCERDVYGKWDCAPPHIDMAIEEHVVHPLYDFRSNNIANDIALLRLAHNVTFNDYVRPICLPHSLRLQQSLYRGRKMEVAGWRHTFAERLSTRKRKAVVQVWDPQECRLKYQPLHVQLQSTHICAGGMIGMNTCSGETGGPLMVTGLDSMPNVYMLVGIDSFGHAPCGWQDWPGVFTRVGAYVPWIENTIRS